MKLSNIRNIGRYQHKERKNAVNMKKGRKVGYGVDVIFYLFRGNRVFVSDFELHNDWSELAKSVDC